jgi:hypothetical protein
MKPFGIDEQGKHHRGHPVIAILKGVAALTTVLGVGWHNPFLRAPVLLFLSTYAGWVLYTFAERMDVIWKFHTPKRNGTETHATAHL